MRSSEATVFLSHTDALFRYAMALSRDRAAAEDLVQETFLRALSASSSLGPDSNCKRWMFTILKNIWLNQLRKGRWTAPIADFDAHEAAYNIPAGPHSNPHLHYVSKMNVLEVRDAIEQLPEEFREMIILREYEELSYQEIARILQCPAGTVMSRLARARSRLRTILSSRRSKAPSMSSLPMSVVPGDPSLKR
jgi:RNA polymerase sigma-70 factor, ECF subfamily